VSDIGKILLGFGVILVILGGLLIVVGNFSDKLPWLGRLPGDIVIERGNFRFYFPLATSILLSILLTLIIWLFRR
jgi:hypothetical protein